MLRAVVAFVCAVLCTALAAPAHAQTTNGQLAVVLGDRIVLVNPDGTGLRPLWKPPSGGVIGGPAWSPDGNTLAFTYADKITVYDLVTGAVTSLTVPGAGARDMDPAWLADGRIGFRRVSSTGQAMHKVALDGTVGSRQLLEPDVDALAITPSFDKYAFRLLSRILGWSGGLELSANAADTPAWSPDSSELAYVELGSILPPYEAGLRVITPAGGQGTRLVAPAPVAQPRWAPDGSRLVYVSDGRVQHVPAAGKQPPVVLPGLAGATAVDWQPCVTGRTTVACSSVLAPTCTTTTAQVTTLADQPVELPAPPCSDPDRLPLHLVLSKDGDHGSVVGSVYTPRPGFVGQDTVAYRVSNGTAESDPVRVTVFVVPRPAAAGPPPPPGTNPPASAAAPFLSLRVKPTLDGRRATLARLACDQACTFTVRLEGTLRGKKQPLKGPTLKRTLAAGRVLALRLKLPAKPKGKLKTVLITGTVRGENGAARPVKLAVTVSR